MGMKEWRDSQPHVAMSLPTGRISVIEHHPRSLYRAGPGKSKWNLFHGRRKSEEKTKNDYKISYSSVPDVLLLFHL